MTINGRNTKGRFLDAFIYQAPKTGRSVLENGTYINMADVVDRIDQGMSTFNELITVEPNTQIDLKSTYPISKLKDIVEVTDGSVTQADGQFRVATSAAGTGDALFRSLERGRYVAGLDAMTGIAISIPTRPTGNQVVEWGPTDFQNGYVVGEDADGLFTGVYRNGVLGSIHRREDWSDPLTDKLNPQQLNIYRMAVRWYGRGPFKLSLATESSTGEGRVSRADATNLIDNGPITFNPNQPISVRIRNNGTAAPLEAYVCGRQFSVYGRPGDVPRMTSEYRLDQSVGTTFVPMVSFRQKSGNYATISTALQSIQAITASANIIWQIRVFSTLTGAAWTDPSDTDNGTETALEVDTAATAISGGVQLYEGIQVAGQGNSPSGSPQNLPGLELPSDGIVISLCARAISGTATVTSVFTLSERW